MTRLLVAIVLVPLVLVAPAAADAIVLKNGTVHFGEVQRRTVLSVVFRTQVDGRWTDLTVARDDLDKLFEDPGDQAADARMDEPQPPARSDAPRPRVPAPDARPAVAIVPLHGQVGGLLDGSVAGTFDASLVEHFLDRAREDGAEVVVLDIQSPGGYLEEMESICELLVARADDQRIVACAGDALSAAAVIALTCRELVVRPGARIGAAVMVQASGEGLSAVDAKLASPHHARQRQFMEASGRPYALLAAMTIQDRRLWWSPTAGFLDDVAAAGSAGDAREVDGATTVLTMLGDDAVRWGVAIGAATPATMAETLGLAPSATVRDYGDEVREFTETLDRRVHDVLMQFRTYFVSLGGIHQLLVQLESGAGGGQEREMVRRQLGQAQRAARSIRRQDRDLLARRTSLPPELLDQLDSDATDLARLASLVRQGDPTSATNARLGVEEILERWRALMTF